MCIPKLIALGDPAVPGRARGLPGDRDPALHLQDPVPRAGAVRGGLPGLGRRRRHHGARPLPLHAAVAAGDLAGRDASCAPCRRRWRSRAAGSSRRSSCSPSSGCSPFIVALIVFGVLFAGLIPTVGLSASIVGFGGTRLDDGRGMGGMGAWAVAWAAWRRRRRPCDRRRPRRRACSGRSPRSLVAQVYLLGLCLVYLRVTEGLDLSATEAALRQKLEEARSRAGDLGEKARAAANRATAPTSPRGGDAAAARTTPPASGAAAVRIPPAHGGRRRRRRVVRCGAAARCARRPAYAPPAAYRRQPPPAASTDIDLPFDDVPPPATPPPAVPPYAPPAYSPPAYVPPPAQPRRRRRPPRPARSAFPP